MYAREEGQPECRSHIHGHRRRYIAAMSGCRLTVQPYHASVHRPSAQSVTAKIYHAGRRHSAASLRLTHRLDRLAIANDTPLPIGGYLAEFVRFTID